MGKGESTLRQKRQVLLNVEEYAVIDLRPTGTNVETSQGRNEL